MSGEEPVPVGCPGGPGSENAGKASPCEAEFENLLLTNFQKVKIS